MTSEWADVSVGLVEGKEGWNTVITRTEVGDALVEEAARAALIQAEPLDTERTAHLAGASSGKKTRARETAKERGLSLPYLPAQTEEGREDD
jgi:coenzyme F420 hydrogenase subunit beta